MECIHSEKIQITKTDSKGIENQNKIPFKKNLSTNKAEDHE